MLYQMSLDLVPTIKHLQHLSLPSDRQPNRTTQASQKLFSSFSFLIGGRRCETHRGADDASSHNNDIGTVGDVGKTSFCGLLKTVSWEMTGQYKRSHHGLDLDANRQNETEKCERTLHHLFWKRVVLCICSKSPSDLP